MNKTLVPALLSATASSLCCIAPVLAAIAGVGGLAGSFSWLEPWRPWLIGLSAVLLAWAWWMHLKPKPAEDCCTPAKKPWHQRTGFVTSVTALAVLLNAFPLYSHVLFPSSQSSVSEVHAEALRIVIPVKGMTCTGCEHHVTDALAGVAGVQRATASYTDEEAVVWVDPQQADPNAIRNAIASTGYEAGAITFTRP